MSKNIDNKSNIKNEEEFFLGKKSIVNYWLQEDNLLLIKSLRRDGYSINDIANRMGISYSHLQRLISENDEIRNALNTGKELVDYKVENALLKSALGYKTQEVKVTTTMRYGKVVETIKEVTDKEVAPNVTAIGMWLYNRQKDKWKNMNAKQNIFDGMVEDSSIEVIVKKADRNETSNGDAPSSDSVEENINEEKTIRLRKRKGAEIEKVKKEKAEREKKERANTKVVEEDEEVNVEEWPEDWEEED